MNSSDKVWKDLSAFDSFIHSVVKLKKDYCLLEVNFLKYFILSKIVTSYHNAIQIQ